MRERERGGRTFFLFQNEAQDVPKQIASPAPAEGKGKTKGEDKGKGKRKEENRGGG